jgi:tetratricopeptide (TPR) repeat protein
MAMALVAATVVTTRQMLDARRQRDKAVFERKRAEAATGFMNNLLSVIGQAGKPITVHELLDQGVSMLSEQYGDDPALGARMLLDFSGRYVDIGDQARKEEVMARAESLAAKSNDPDLYSGILCARGEDLARAGNVAGAKVLLTRGYKEMERVVDRGKRFGIACRYAEALVARVEGRSDTAIALMKGIVGGIRAEGDTNSRSYMSNLNELGIHLATAGRVREAYEAYREAYAVLERTGRANSSTALVIRHNVADALARMGEFIAADTMVRALLVRWKSVDSTQPGPNALRTASRLQWALARPDSARLFYQRVLAMEGRPGSEDMMRIVRTELAQVDAEQGKLDDAKKLLAALEKSPLRGAPGSVRTVRAKLLRAEGKPDSALDAATDILKRGDYPTRPPTFSQLVMLLFGADCAIESHRLDIAERYAGSALDVAKQAARSPEKSGYVGDALMLSARIKLARGDRTGARDAVREAIPSLTNGYGAAHPSVQKAQQLLATIETGA